MEHFWRLLYMLHPFGHPVLHVAACCCVLLGVVAESLKWLNIWSQQLPTFLLFRGRQSRAQQCCIHLHATANTDETTPNIVGPNSLITFKARFWQTCFGIMLYWKFRKIKPLLFKMIMILLIIIIYKINISVFNLFQILSSLLVSPYFFLDVLYVHELPSEHNLCKVSSIEYYRKIFKTGFLTYQVYD